MPIELVGCRGASWMMAKDEGGAKGTEEMRRTEQARDGHWEDGTGQRMQPKAIGTTRDGEHRARAPV